MSEYHKIETLFERDKETFRVDPTKLKSPVLETIKEWDVTEKVDGTNIRVMLSQTGTASFGGRSDNAQIPADLVKYLIETFSEGKLQEVLWRDGPADVVLYGEGYGAGIQKVGKLYRPDKAFILFDVLVAGQWWLEREAVEEIATKLRIQSVPYLGRMTMEEIVTLVSGGLSSALAACPAEGVVARPIETLFDRNMRRVIIKLKTKDFIGGKMS